MKRELFRGPLGEADSNGSYVSMGKRYQVSVTDTELRIDKQCIPLVKIAEVAKIGQGIRVVYLNEHDVPKSYCFTAGTLFLFMGRKGVEDFYRVLSEATPKAHAELPPEQAIAPAPPDTCEHCGAKGAVAIRFGHVFSPLAYAQEIDYTAVVCKKHATSIGLKELAWTGLGGWWGLGALVAPKYIFQTVKALIQHSNLNPVLCVLLGLLALTPLAILIPLFVDAIQHSQGHPGRP